MAWGVGLYVLCSIGVGLWAAQRVKNSQDFLTASRRLPLLLSMSILFSTWFGAETILGASETFVEGGLLAVIEDPFGSALCLILVGLWLAKPFYRLPVRTFGDFYAVHFGRAAERIATPLMAFSYIGWIAAQLVAMGLVIEHFSGLSHQSALILATLLILSYTMAGGMWSVAAVDIGQNIVLIGGLIGMLFFLPSDWLQTDQLPNGFLAFTPKASLQGWLQYLAAWMTIGLGSLPQQDMYQRVVSARSEKTAQWAAISAGLLYLVVGLVPLAGALYVRLHHPEWLTGDNHPLLALVSHYLPAWMQMLFWGALVSAIMSSASGGLLAPAALLSENVLRPWMRHQDLIRVRLAVLLTSIVCWAFAAYNPHIYELVGESSIFSLVTLFIPMVVGLHAPKWRSGGGALFSMLSGLGGYYVAKWYGTTIPPLWHGMGASLLGYFWGHLLVIAYARRP